VISNSIGKTRLGRRAQHHLAHRGQREQQVALAAGIGAVHHGGARQAGSARMAGLDAVGHTMKLVAAGNKAQRLIVTERPEVFGAELDEHGKGDFYRI
jgi:hypothetical protein